ncbi:glycine cleavage H-protein [Lentilactobacillus kefiri DSM 20587 = JCM 5818]|jgi:glycine cleavage system H protein|uniref:Glycine cleavage H-protein n=2 Tax=Lentilactobacillus kefiri TaxID=33962 RepID=A0A8E1RJ34_LENKE|nr:glycine cleavage H-protein [Lentilactobacillus parakefiri DSM 10551]KRM52584.1 glycine cleavage H-protein [Lentilactobacillus kefiri DSM 20587 = JCM 5818]
MMANKVDDSKYLWTDKTSDGHTRIGLNDLARGEIGQVTFAEFPEKMTEVAQGDPILSFEGSKAVTEIHSPIGGKVAKVNEDLIEHPELLNEDDPDKTWIVELF